MASSSGWAWNVTRVPGTPSSSRAVRACGAWVRVRRGLATVYAPSLGPEGEPMRRVLVVVTVTLVTSALVAVESVTARAAKRAVPGVTKTAIKVGGLASPPNDTLNVSYPDGFDGVEAYFDKVNKAGGVFGRKFEMVAKLSDQGQPSANIRAVRSLVEEKKVFAVLPIMTNSFTLGGR
ncbi:MAG: hypothetical protein E6G14_16905, partial [Actinobacteria bacterium]